MLNFLETGQIKYSALNMHNHENKSSLNTYTISITDSIASI